MRATRFSWSTPVTWLAWLSLALAFVLGQVAAKPDYQALLQHYLPGVEMTPGDYGNRGPVVFDLVQNKPNSAEVLLLGEGEGYGGPMLVGISASRTDSGARIHDVIILDNKETPPYVERLKKKHFFRQFANRPVTNDFVLDADLDGYSGATITARGIAQTVRDTVHLGAVEHLQLEPTWQADPWDLGLEELGMLLLMVIAIYLSVTRSKSKVNSLLKVGLPIAALAFVGFYVNASVSLGSLSAIVMGYIPSPKQHPIWWIMMGGILLGILVLGRNVYCNKLCPFSTVQDLLSKISGIKLKVDPKLAKHARTLILTMIWTSLMLIFLSRHQALGSYEPFSMMFALEGMGMQWYILPFSLIGAFFIPNFWCRFFCPVGLTLNEAVRVRRKLVGKMTPAKAIPVTVKPHADRRSRQEKTA